jgi:ribosomal protein L12E/L44/L45/RPP1/RPP2
MVSAGIVPPEKVEFVNPMIFFKRIAPIVGEKNIEEFLIRAQAPPAPAAPKGQASQPSQNGQQGIEAELLNQGAAFG